MHKHQNPIPTNGVILENKKGEILLVRRKKYPKKGFWDLPGGFVEAGENMEESVQREIKEELGIELKEFTYFSSYPDRYFYQGKYEKILGFIFTGNIGNKTIKPASDISGFKFFLKDKIPYHRLAFKSLKTAFKDYLNSSRSTK